MWLIPRQSQFLKGYKMAGISIGIKRPEFPVWVDEIYEQMTPDERELDTKTNIYGSCCKTNEGYQITAFVAALSNRVSMLDTAEQVAIAISLADSIYPWEFLPGNSTQDYKCKHCGAEFETKMRRPACEKCGKYEWEDKK